MKDGLQQDELDDQLQPSINLAPTQIEIKIPRKVLDIKNIDEDNFQARKSYPHHMFKGYRCESLNKGSDKITSLFKTYLKPVKSSLPVNYEELVLLA